MALRTSIGWLEPLLPESVPQHVQEKSERLQCDAFRLRALLAPETAECVRHLMRAANSFYSNLIEGEYAEPLALVASAAKREKIVQVAPACKHMGAQLVFERALRRYRAMPWDVLFSPEFVEHVHDRLFNSAEAADLSLPNPAQMIPGKFRGRNVGVGTYVAPDHDSVRPMIERMHVVYGRQKGFLRQLLSVLAYHHRFAWVHPFQDGNGRTIRLMTHLHLQRLGLSSDLWSLSRGVAKHRSSYYVRLQEADQPRRGDYDGRGQLTERGLFEFIDFMLDVCLEQVDYMIQSLNPLCLRERLDVIVCTEPQVIEAGIRPEAAQALHALIRRGYVRHADFESYLGLESRAAAMQLDRLMQLGLVNGVMPDAGDLYPGLPGWFAQKLFPDLYARFS